MKKNDLTPITQLDWYMYYRKGDFHQAVNDDQLFLRMLLDVKYPDKIVISKVQKICLEAEKPGYKYSRDELCKAISYDNKLLKKILKPILPKIQKNES